MTPRKQPKRYSKRKAGEKPEYTPAENLPIPKRQKSAPSTQSAKPALTRKPKKRAAKAIADLPRIAPSQGPTPIASPWALHSLNLDRQKRNKPPIRWSFQSTSLYRSSQVKDAFLIDRSATKPFEKNWEKTGGAAFVRCFRLPGDEDHGVGEGVHLEGKRLQNCVRPVVQDLWVGERAQVSWDDQVSALARTTKRGQLNALKPRRVAELFRVGKVGEEKEFFFWWQDSRAIRVNGVRVIRPDSETVNDVAIGPLPDFAVIQVEDAALFFWKNEAALDYRPASVETDKIRLSQEEDEAKRQEAEAKAAAEAKKKEAEEKAAEEARRQEEEWRIAEEQLDKDLFGEADQNSDPQTTLQQAAAQGPNNLSETIGREQGDQRRFHWRITWESRVQRYEERRDQDPNVDHHQLESWADLVDEDVVLGIATVWDAVVSQVGRPFAFNDHNQYGVVRSAFEDKDGKRAKVLAAVHGPHDLLIPMVMDGYYISPPNSAGFPPEQDPNNRTTPPPTAVGDNPKEYKGSNGHTILAVAQLVVRDESNGDQVRMIVMDSYPGNKPAERIENNVGKTIRRIGWLGMDKDGRQIENRDAPPRIIERKQLRVPHQVSVNSCGIHTILNAWRYMLELPELDSNVRLHGKHYLTEEQAEEEESQFIEGALTMINLALAGYMDLLTIQAFFNYYGYCQLQDPDNPTERQSSRIMTRQMKHSTLLDILDDERAIRRSSAATPKESAFPEEAVRRVREVAPNCNYSMAEKYLIDAKGDADEAAGLALSETPR
ncbi:MAG: hypothetical protein Q9209_000828 [Squamulea sp. 1 TL-2023]